MADFTIRDVLEWARTKPANERYEYGDTNNCALCQFLRETGRAALPQVGGFFWDDQGLDRPVKHPIPLGVTRALIAITFGGLVERLETFLPAVSDTWTQPDAYLTDIEQVTA